jgi:hypothetical protein
MTKNELIELASDLLKQESPNLDAKQKAQRLAVLDRYLGALESVQYFAGGFTGMSYNAPLLGTPWPDDQAQVIIDVDYRGSRRLWASMKIVFWVQLRDDAPVDPRRRQGGPRSVGAKVFSGDLRAKAQPGGISWRKRSKPSLGRHP